MSITLNLAIIIQRAYLINFFKSISLTWIVLLMYSFIFNCLVANYENLLMDFYTDLTYFTLEQLKLHYRQINFKQNIYRLKGIRTSFFPVFDVSLMNPEFKLYINFNYINLNTRSITSKSLPINKIFIHRLFWISNRIFFIENKNTILLILF